MRSLAQSMNRDPTTTVAPLNMIMPVYEPSFSLRRAPATGPPHKDLHRRASQHGPHLALDTRTHGNEMML